MASEDATSTNHLESGAVGLPHIVFQSVTMMSPGAAVAFSLAVGVLFAGPVLPLSVLLALIGCLLVAYALSQQAKHVPSAGSLFAYACKAYGRRGGFFVGWCVAIYILFFIPAVYLLFPVIVDQVFARDLGISIGWAPWAIAGAVLVAAVALRGVHFSSTVAMGLGALEVAVFVALSIWMLTSSHAHLSGTPFLPSHSPTGFTGVFKGAVFGILAFTGFEAAAAFGEEGREPRKSIPRALIVATIAVGLFYVFCSYGWVIGTGVDSFQKTVTSSTNPWVGLASKYWGVGWVAIFLALINSVFAVTLSAVNSGTRILYSMGRAGMLPKPMAAVHKKYHTPSVAIIAASIWGLVVALLAGWKWGAGTGFGVVATVLTIFAILAYISASVGVFTYYWRHRQGKFRVVRHGIVPFAGAAAFLVVLYYQFVPLPAAPIVYANWVSVGLFAVVAAFTVLGHSRTLPITDDAHIGFEDLDAVSGSVVEVPVSAQ